MQHDTTTQPRKLVPVTQWQVEHDWPTEAGLRHLIFHEHENGFHRCVRRVGRRVLVDEDEFYRWVDSQNGSGAVA